jgi:DNA-binding transcriptional MocR family regulator
MDLRPDLRPDSAVPLYRQLYEYIASRIRSGELETGEKLPPTRELAGLLGLNRTTVSAAYEILESEGLIAGQVGRGSFVTGQPAPARGGVDWSNLVERVSPSAPSGSTAHELISFATSRPSREMFPLDEFRASCAAVLARPDLADILQLGSPSGYEPLRRYLLDHARRQGHAAEADDLLIANGCQQALDLIGRVLLRPGDAVVVEDPIYPGLKTLLAGFGARLIAVPVLHHGLDVAHMRHVLEAERPRMMVVTPNFQNPTGATMPEAARVALIEAARAAGVPVVENDPYGDLRYSGQPVAAIKQLDDRHGTVLLRSFSKVSFPGLRVGWVVGPRPLLDRLRQAKEAADLHSDQLSQAVLLEFAESGRLEAHLRRVLAAGADRLAAAIEGCRRFLPPGTRWTEPEGGMNLWVRLPDPLDAGELLPRAQREGVNYLPARYFTVARHEPGALRVSFACLNPESITNGLDILGRVIAGELAGAAERYEPVPAMV